jgi:hypothetical protein
MELHRLRQRLRNLVRQPRVPVITHEELDENTAGLIDAVLQSLVFCLSLLALVTFLQRLPPLPSPPAGTASGGVSGTAPSGRGAVWPTGQDLSLGFTG